MKPFPTIVWLSLAMATASCASTGMSDADKLATYRSHAGAPVRSFQFFGQINGWTPLGDSAVAVWTKPSEAWLLELSGRCPGVDYAPAITVTSQFNRVSAKFDKVVPVGSGTMEIPCQISEIRPLDVKAIKQAEKIGRDQPAAGSSGT